MARLSPIIAPETLSYEMTLCRKRSCFSFVRRSKSAAAIDANNRAVIAGRIFLKMIVKICGVDEPKFA